MLGEYLHYSAASMNLLARVEVCVVGAVGRNTDDRVSLVIERIVIATTILEAGHGKSKIFEE